MLISEKLISLFKVIYSKFKFSPLLGSCQLLLLLTRLGEPVPEFWMVSVVKRPLVLRKKR